MHKKVPFLKHIKIVNRKLENFCGEKLYVSTGALNVNMIDYSQVEIVTYDNKPSRATVIAEKDDVLFAKMKETKKTLLVSSDEKNLIFSSGFYCLETDNKMLLPEYLHIYISSPFFLDQKDKLCTGATQKALNIDGLKKIQIPLPNLNEQKKIANIINKTYNLIKLRKEQIKKLDLLIKSQFVEMFGDPILNEKKFQIISLMNCYDKEDAIKCGPFGSALKKDEYIETGIPVWNMDNITKQGEFLEVPNLWITLEKYNKLKSYNVHNGDIIISRAGTVGKMCVVISEYEISIISTNLIRLRLNEKILPLYFVMLLNVHGNKVCKLRTGRDSSFTHMNTGVLNSIEFPLPPIELQNKFLAFVQQVDKQKSGMLQGQEKLEQNYKALMQQYFG